MSTLVLLRHGQSVWNLAGKFTGHSDVELTAKGIKEAVTAGEQIQQIEFDQVFSSPLKRAWDTAILAVGEDYYLEYGVTIAPELIERDYGDLDGKTFDEVAEIYKKEQINQWRNGYDFAPPNGESLSAVGARIIPFFNGEIKPLLEQDKNVLIVSHRNTLRALIQYIEDVPNDEVEDIDVNTGRPIIFNS